MTLIMAAKETIFSRAQAEVFPLLTSHTVNNIIKS